MEFRHESYILKAFIASAILALIMMVLAFGLIHLFRYGSPLSIPIILIMAALSFILSASFFERYEVGSIIWSALVSIIVTLILTLLSGGIIYSLTANKQGWEDLSSSLAVCMIVAMTMLHYLKRSLGEIEY
jgi:hypothetical protein